MVTDRFGGQRQPRGNLDVGEALDQQCEHFDLPSGELASRYPHGTTRPQITADPLGSGPCAQCVQNGECLPCRRLVAGGNALPPR